MLYPTPIKTDLEPHESINPSGLTKNEVELNRKKYGLNVEKTHDFTTVKIIFKTLLSPFNVVMTTLIIILFLVGERSSAKFIGIVAAVNTTIELIQQIRARMIIQKLNKLSEKTSTVLREGSLQELSIQDLVIGDIIHIASGDRVPVDGELMSSEYAEFDESILTGESHYIEKKVGDEVKAGSFIAAGSCFYKMTKFTRDSYMETLTKKVANQTVSESPLESQINQIIRSLTYMTIFFIALLVAEGLVQQNQTQEIIINTATLVSTLVPQGLVLITTISFAFGAMKIAKSEAVVQKLSAVESMANTKIVCMDKTGTLTKNQFEVKKCIWI